MPIFEDDSEMPIPTWTMDDVEVLEAIDPQYASGLVELLRFLIAEEGVFADETLDLTVVIHSLVEKQYTFDEVQNLVSVASEFCLIDCLYHKQNLEAMELADNAVLLLALQEEDDLALEAALVRSRSMDSLFASTKTRPSLGLFGHWEDLAAELLFCMLTRDTLSDTIGSTYKYMSATFKTDIEFVDFIRKMCEIGLVSTEIEGSGKANIKIDPVASGLFLLFSSRTDLAAKLAELAI